MITADPVQDGSPNGSILGAGVPFTRTVPVLGPAVRMNELATSPDGSVDGFRLSPQLNIARTHDADIQSFARRNISIAASNDVHISIPGGKPAEIGIARTMHGNHQIIGRSFGLDVA